MVAACADGETVKRYHVEVDVVVEVVGEGGGGLTVYRYHVDVDVVVEVVGEDGGGLTVYRYQVDVEVTVLVEGVGIEVTVYRYQVEVDVTVYRYQVDVLIPSRKLTCLLSEETKCHRGDADANTYDVVVAAGAGAASTFPSVPIRRHTVLRSFILSKNGSNSG